MTRDHRRLAAIVRRMQDLPGEELFRYLDDDGVAHLVEDPATFLVKNLG